MLIGRPLSCENMRHLFFLNPDFVTLDVAFAVFYGLDIRNGSRTRDGLDDAKHLFAESRIALRSQHRCIDLVDKSALSIGLDHYPGLMRAPFTRFVSDITHDGLKKNY